MVNVPIRPVVDVASPDKSRNTFLVAGDPRDWCLVELQGRLETDGEALDGLELGTIAVDGKNPVLVIGNHRLEGKVVELTKPIAIIDRVYKSKTDAAVGVHQGGRRDGQTSNGNDNIGSSQKNDARAQETPERSAAGSTEGAASGHPDMDVDSNLDSSACSSSSTSSSSSYSSSLSAQRQHAQPPKVTKSMVNQYSTPRTSTRSRPFVTSKSPHSMNAFAAGLKLSTPATPDTPDTPMLESGEGKDALEEFRVVGIIRRKYLFKNRPETIL